MKHRLPYAILGAAVAGAAFYPTLRRYQREREELEYAAASLVRRNEQLTALSNVFSQIAADMSFQNVVNASLRETARIMGADMVSLRRVEGEWLVSVGAMLQDGRPVKLASDMQMGVGLTGTAAAEQRTIRIDRDAELSMSPRLPANGGREEDQGLSPSEQTRTRRQESGIIAPLVVGSRVVGALAVWSQEVAHFTKEDEAVLEMMASQVATAMVAASIMEERERQAHLDALTGLPNRLQLAKDMGGELAALAGLSRAAVFAMVDIDHFKEFNDEYGHGAGDVVLQNLGSVMRTAIRSSDNVYRYGGEEFLIVFMNAGPTEGYRLAERLRQAIEKQMNDMRPVTVSIGLASLPDDGTDPRTLIELADSAMYQAKRGGRNRTVVWEEAQAEQRPAVA
jgi:diguanylate cyclase (GGDEF)-like protein